MAVGWHREDNEGFWIISLEPYSEILLLPGRIYPVGWSPDGTYVYAIRSESNGLGREVVRVQVAAPNEARSVASLPGDVDPFNIGSLSPNGHEIVVRISEQKSDVWLMENFDPAPQ